MKTNSDGMIIGGVCDTKHHDRVLREKGANMYLTKLIESGCLQSYNGWQSITKLPRESKKQIYGIGALYGTNVEIGYRRFKTDVIENLFESKKHFRSKWLKRWLEDICSFEFGAKMKNPLAILDALAGDKEACQFGYAPPHQDALYKKRMARGDFN